MADQTTSSTQQAAQAVANRMTSGGQNATTPSPSTVAQASQTGAQTPANLSITLPPSLKDGGKK